MEQDIVVRLVLAATLGGLVGLERESRDQPAGFRTHILVALGACLFTLASAFGFQEAGAQSAEQAIRADVTRIASQVVVGIGFLGGGTILRHGATVRGLTTAASLWVTAAVGLAVGAGMWIAALTTAALAIIALSVLKPVERWLFRLRRSEAEGPDAGLPSD